jgi:hypothetical protein
VTWVVDIRPDEIVPNLWQGGYPGSWLHDFEAVVNMTPDLCPEIPGFTGVYVQHAMNDVDELPDMDALGSIVDFVVSSVGAGRKTLVHCHAGLNRSGLVVALALVKMGRKPVDAIALQRSARDSFVLCNRTFERYVLDLDPETRLPSAADYGRV